MTAKDYICFKMTFLPYFQENKQNRVGTKLKLSRVSDSSRNPRWSTPIWRSMQLAQLHNRIRIDTLCLCKQLSQHRTLISTVITGPGRHEPLVGAGLQSRGQGSDECGNTVSSQHALLTSLSLRGPGRNMYKPQNVQ